MSQTSNTNNTNQNDDIDLTSLILDIWKHKNWIILATILTTTIGTLHILYATPVYRVSAQLNPPPAAELEGLKALSPPNKDTPFLYVPDESFIQQQMILSLMGDNLPNKASDKQEITAEKAFTLFLNTLSSHSHITKIAKDNTALLEQALNIPADDNLLSNINLYRTIQFPNTIKKINDLAPDSYTITLEGQDRESLQSLLRLDLNVAQQATTKRIKQFFINQIDQEIQIASNRQASKISNLKNEISARKSYLQNSISDKIRELKMAQKIALTLEITTPSDKHRTISDKSPNYLRGTKFLAAEISNLERLDKTKLTDNDLRLMEAQLLLIQNDSRIKSLQHEKERIASKTKSMNFYNHIFEAPETAIAPKKPLILTISILLGMIIGTLIATGKIIFSKTKAT